MGSFLYDRSGYLVDAFRILDWKNIKE